MDHIPQDYLEGDLRSKSLVELKDLLIRQENLLKKRNFIKTLPDGGKKVEAFVEKLQNIIEERKAESKLGTKAQDTPRKRISKFKKQSEQKSNSNRSCNANFDSVVGEESEHAQSDLVDQLGTLHKESVDCHYRRDKVFLTDLEDQLQHMEISSDTHVKYPAEEHIFSIIERTQNYRNRPPQKLNRDLKISKVEDLPEEYLFYGKSKMSSDYLSSKKVGPLWEESAVCPPNYKYSMAKEMSLQESLSLQEGQKRKQEEAQAEFAAEKLAAKLSIKMETFNPEGKDISYREPEIIDSDDDLEGVD